MRVPVFTELETLEFQDKPKPVVQAGDVLVKVAYCGICGSDVHGYLNGIMVPIGTVMGHECSGVIAEVGEGVEGFSPGDRVAVKPIPQCGECYWCKKGQYSLCPSSFENAPGITTANDGAFAEYVLIKYPHKMLFKLPDSLSLEDAALTEPLATSLHGVRMSRFKVGDSVVVIGAGMIGMGVVQFLRLGGAGQIIVLEVDPKKAQIVKDLGADIVFDPVAEGDTLRDSIFERTAGVGADIVYECAGVPMSFKTCINYVKSGGQVMLIGINDKEVSINPFMMVLWEVEMKGVLGYYDEFKSVLDLLEKNKIQTKPMITDVINLADVEQKGFKRLLSSKDAIKILVKP